MIRGRKEVLSFDWVLLSVFIGLLVYSALVLYSATYKVQNLNIENTYILKQSLWMAVGLVSMFFVSQIDYKKLGMSSGFIYVVCIILLIAVLVFGRKISGSRRWLHIAGMALQPSEFMKISLILCLAWFFKDVRGARLPLSKVAIGGLMTLLPLLLIAKEPDLGTALVLVPTFLAMAFVAGLSWKVLLSLLGSGVAMLPFIWLILKDYQKKRIFTFLNPYDDQFGAGWPVIQSKIAIGSGRFFGKGYLKGSQTQLDFLPERHTDFIFSVLGEEWGYLGVVVIFVLFFILFSRALYIAEHCGDKEGRLIITGLVALMSFQFIVNVGMTFGFLPVTGLPLPFFSYGGSAMLSLCLGMGVVFNIARQMPRGLL